MVCNYQVNYSKTQYCSYSSSHIIQIHIVSIANFAATNHICRCCLSLQNGFDPTCLANCLPFRFPNPNRNHTLHLIDTTHRAEIKINNNPRYLHVNVPVHHRRRSGCHRRRHHRFLQVYGYTWAGILSPGPNTVPFPLHCFTPDHFCLMSIFLFFDPLALKCGFVFRLPDCLDVLPWQNRLKLYLLLLLIR